MSTAPPSTRRTTSLTGSSRLSLSVGRTSQSPSGTSSGRHPLKQEWTLSYVHRPPGAKVDYEKEIRKVAKFGSIESFLHLYSHLTPANELPPVTDLLVFAGRIGRPGVWEEMRDGGKFTLRLAHPITPLLYETLLFSLLGDQFDDADSVVGCVLSCRQTEDILSVWVEEEGESVKSGALREKILSLLSLPPTTACEYRSNKALLDAASSIKPYQSGAHTNSHAEGGSHPHGGSHEQGYNRHHGRYDHNSHSSHNTSHHHNYNHQHQHQHHSHHNQHHYSNRDRDGGREGGEYRDRGDSWGNRERRDGGEYRERRDGGEYRERREGGEYRDRRDGGDYRDRREASGEYRERREGGGDRREYRDRGYNSEYNRGGGVDREEGGRRENGWNRS